MVTALKAESVLCPHCTGLGRSITVCTRDAHGALLFIGKLTPSMRLDLANRKMTVPCRGCGQPMVFDLQ